jgi:hypothetical protein
MKTLETQRNRGYRGPVSGLDELIAGRTFLIESFFQQFQLRFVKPTVPSLPPFLCVSRVFCLAIATLFQD